MRIAVIEHAEGGDYSGYIFSLIEEQANQYGYQVKAWSNSVPLSQQRIGENAFIFISLESKSSFLLNWLYSVKIPSILKKIKADVVLDLNGIASSKIKIPQLIAVGPPIFSDNVRQLSKTARFAVSHLKLSQQLATAILLYSIQQKENAQITPGEKIQTLPFTAPEEFRTFEWHEKIMPKSKFADNRDYFITVMEEDAVSDFVLLLKGFSRFKKWQQSNMQLIILPKVESFGVAIREKHATYKYKEDVQLLDNLPEEDIAPLFASAHSFLHVAGDQPQFPILSIAMQCSLPVISFNSNDVKEYCGDSVLFCTETTEEALGNNLIQLYKNENLQAQLKEAAGRQALQLVRNEYAAKLWQLFQQQAKK